MSYEKTEWKTGDVVTAQKLNKIETGIFEGGSGGDGSVEIINIDTTISPKTCDKTYAEILSLIENNKTIIARVKIKVYDTSDDYYYTETYDIPFVHKESSSNKLIFIKTISFNSQSSGSMSSLSYYFIVNRVYAEISSSNEVNANYIKYKIGVSSVNSSQLSPS